MIKKKVTRLLNVLLIIVIVGVIMFFSDDPFFSLVFFLIGTTFVVALKSEKLREKSSEKKYRFSFAKSVFWIHDLLDKKIQFDFKWRRELILAIVPVCFALTIVVLSFNSPVLVIYTAIGAISAAYALI